MEQKRKQAPRLARPAARYWKGKAPKGVVEVESDSDEGLDQQPVEQEGDFPIGGDQDILDVEDGGIEGGTLLPVRKEVEIVQRTSKTINVSLKDVDISKDGKVIVAGREESGRTIMEREEESDEESAGEEVPRIDGRAYAESEESSEYGSESEEEESKPQFRPVFVPKRARATIVEKEDEEALRLKEEQEAEERRKQSHDLVAESIKRELAEREKDKEGDDVDDTDGLDLAAEFEAWRLRELGRIKKEKEEELQRELEREEVEKRRALPEEQRLKEDLQRAQKLRDDKPKGQQKFLQKYWHKGAFHQDFDILKRHDYTEATESTVDVSLLPKVMQVKDFGKRSRTKYTHLLDQDTTVGPGGFGGAGPTKQGRTLLEGGGCFTCGGPHLKKDCPQNTGPLSERGLPRLNAPQNGLRKWGNPPESQGTWRDRDDDDQRGPSGGKHVSHRYDDDRRREDRGHRGGEDRKYGRRSDGYDKRNSRRRSRSYSRSRSRSPHRDDFQRSDWRRSRERSVDTYRDKRRRLD